MRAQGTTWAKRRRARRTVAHRTRQSMQTRGMVLTTGHLAMFILMICPRRLQVLALPSMSEQGGRSEV
jgi:hypothetical protein